MPRLLGDRRSEALASQLSDPGKDVKPIGSETAGRRVITIQVARPFSSPGTCCQQPERTQGGVITRAVLLQSYGKAPAPRNHRDLRNAARQALLGKETSVILKMNSRKS